jgi:murein endopeptidase
MGTKLLVEVLLKFDNMEKIFIEPHLKSRLGLTNSKIRYHGCGAVRHDDHIHIQVK